MAKRIFELPHPSSGVAGITFVQEMHKNCKLICSWEFDLDQPIIVSLEFIEVWSLKRTYLKSDHSAYDHVVDMGHSEYLDDIRRRLANKALPFDNVRHYMICFDDGPCWEFVCRDFNSLVD